MDDPGNYGIHLDYIAHAQESLGSALARVREVLEDDDRHLAATLRGNQGDSSATNKLRVPCGEAEVAAVNAKRA